MYKCRDCKEYFDTPKAYEDKVDTLIGTDANKSVRTIAAEELAERAKRTARDLFQAKQRALNLKAKNDLRKLKNHARM